VNIGDSETVVLERFGRPGITETTADNFKAYIDKPCQSPCIKRMWWEAPFPIPKGIEAWAVEFDGTQHVINKTHILFP
jgi:hypothetical protein